MRPRRQSHRMAIYLSSFCANHFTKWQTGNQLYYKGGRYWQVLLYHSYCKQVYPHIKVCFAFKIDFVKLPILMPWSNKLYSCYSGPSPSDKTSLVKSRSREIVCYNDNIALNFDRYVDSAAVEEPVKLQSDWKNLNPNVAVSRLLEVKRPPV